MAFIRAMDAGPKTKQGVNGESVLTEDGVGDFRVTLYTMLNRGLQASYMAQHVEKARTQEEWEDLFVMAFQTRDIRGGKGERDLFQNLFSELAKRKPVEAAALVPLIPTYGCWRDMWVLLQLPSIPHIVKDAVLRFVKAEWDENRPDSLLAKWLPREKSKTFSDLVPMLVRTLIPDGAHRQRLVRYRKQVAERNRVLKTTEINMCGGTWSTIEPTHVPGRCLKIHKAAFLNKALTKRRGFKTRVVTESLRFPDSEDRNECRANFLTTLQKVARGEASLKGANVVHPHEIVAEFLKYRSGCDVDTDIDATLEAQWASIRDSAKSAGGLRKMVPMCDFSGSMSGIPLLVSMALGILISEVNHEAFKDRILTFDSEPEWHSFVGMKTVKQKIQSTIHAGQGLSTNFFLACQKIVERMEVERVPVGEEPEDLIVLTDMGWDAAANLNNSREEPWKTQIQRIQDMFVEASRRVWGPRMTGWKVPRIVVWNLCSSYNDFHATATDQGVVMVSGWSPAILKKLQGDGIPLQTPWSLLRAVLDDPRYQSVREALSTSFSV